MPRRVSSLLEASKSDEIPPAFGGVGRGCGGSLRSHATPAARSPAPAGTAPLSSARASASWAPGEPASAPAAARAAAADYLRSKLRGRRRCDAQGALGAGRWAGTPARRHARSTSAGAAPARLCNEPASESRVSALDTSASRTAPEPPPAPTVGAGGSNGEGPGGAAGSCGARAAPAQAASMAARASASVLGEERNPARRARASALPASAAAAQCPAAPARSRGAPVRDAACPISTG